MIGEIRAQGLVWVVHKLEGETVCVILLHVLHISETLSTVQGHVIWVSPITMTMQMFVDMLCFVQIFGWANQIDANSHETPPIAHTDI